MVSETQDRCVNTVTGYHLTNLGPIDGPHDGTGRRIGIDDGTNLSQHLYDGPNPRLKYIDGNPVTTLLGGFGLGTHHARTTSGTTLSYLTDGLGSTMSLANSLGITANYTYTPFGQAVVAGDPGGNDLAFTGRPLDPSGLYQLRARYYHPGLQRFISEDPLGLAAGPTNHYLYAANDPINHTDRTGLAVANVNSTGSIVYYSYQLFAGARKNQFGDSLWDVFGAVTRFLARVAECTADPVCVATYYGTVSVTACAVVCSSVGRSEVGGQTAYLGGGSFAGFPGVMLGWSPGEPGTSTGITGGVCVVVCLGFTKETYPGRALTIIIGVGSRGPWGGVYGQTVSDD